MRAIEESQSSQQGFYIESSIWDKYSRITVQDKSSKRYVSNVTKTLICRFIELKKGYSLEKIPGRIDLCLLLSNYADLWSQLFGMMEQEGGNQWNQIIYQSGVDSVVKTCYKDAKAVILQRQQAVSYGVGSEFDGIVFGMLPKIIFEHQKEVLIDYLRVPKDNRVTVSWEPHGICEKCGSRWNYKYEDMEEQVCSNEECQGHKKRQKCDYLFLENHCILMSFVPKRGMDQRTIQNLSKQFLRLKKIDLLPGDRPNNLKYEIEGNDGVMTRNWQCTQFITWRGSLVEKTLVTNMAMISRQCGHAVLHAIQNFDRLPLRIQKVGWIEGRANRGVIALRQIPAKTVITTYTGEMYLGSEYPFWIHQDSAVGWGWDRNNQIFLIPNNTANVGRFLNGSRTKIEANVEVRWTLIDGSISHEGQFLPGLHLVMISRRLIKAGEQLQWYYGKNFNEHMKDEE